MNLEKNTMDQLQTVKNSVADPYVFGPAGSGLARHTDPSKIQQK
jgi:hypothetical protein